MSLVLSMKSFQRSDTELVRAAEENTERLVALRIREPPNRKQPTGDLRMSVPAEDPRPPETKHFPVTVTMP